VSEIACSVDFQWVEMRQQNFFASGPNFTNFFLFKRGLAVVDHLLFHFWQLTLFQRHSQSKSKVVWNKT